MQETEPCSGHEQSRNHLGATPMLGESICDILFPLSRMSSLEGLTHEYA